MTGSDSTIHARLAAALLLQVAEVPHKQLLQELQAIKRHTYEVAIHQ